MARRILLVGTNVAIAWLTLNSSLEVLDDHLLAQRGGCLPGIEHGALHFCIWFMFCFFLEVMMKAHKEGVAVVGTYAFETAEAGPSDKLILDSDNL